MRMWISLLLALNISLGAMIIVKMFPENISIIGNFLRIHTSYNTNIAFSIRIPSPLKEILISSAFAAVLLVSMQLKKTKMEEVGFGLIVGGAAANLINRIIDGWVLDFIAVGTFPIFNIADSFICIGAGLLLFEYISSNNKRSVIR